MARQTLLILVLLGAILGCSRKAIIHKYYLIEATVSDSLVLDRPRVSDASCEIAPVIIRPAFASERIALRMKSHELIYYTYHKWAVNPEETLQQLIETQLQNHRLFATISSRVWKLIPDYQLQTHIYQLEVLEQQDKLLAHINLDFTLIENESKNIIVHHQADRKRPLKEKDLNLFAVSISEIFLEELDLFSEKIKLYLRSAKPRSGK